MDHKIFKHFETRNQKCWNINNLVSNWYEWGDLIWIYRCLNYFLLMTGLSRILSIKLPTGNTKIMTTKRQIQKRMFNVYSFVRWVNYYKYCFSDSVLIFPVPKFHREFLVWGRRSWWVFFDQLLLVVNLILLWGAYQMKFNSKS